MQVEGFGMPLLESQAIGTPVVTTDFGAMADHVANGCASRSPFVWYLGEVY
jgi:glycosyltransferase involved in cell wall biosynthesis